MTTIYHCPHCQTQNFATPERLRLAGRMALVCWKCGQEIERPDSQKCSKGHKAKDRRAKRVRGNKP